MAKRTPKKFEDVVAEAKAAIPKEERESLLQEIASRSDSRFWMRAGIFAAALLSSLYASHCNTAQHIDTTKIQIDSTAKEQTDTLKKQYRNWRKQDSILNAERWDSLFHLLQ